MLISKVKSQLKLSKIIHRKDSAKEGKDYRVLWYEKLTFERHKTN